MIRSGHLSSSYLKVLLRHLKVFILAAQDVHLAQSRSTTGSLTQEPRLAGQAPRFVVVLDGFQGLGLEGGHLGVKQDLGAGRGAGGGGGRWSEALEL